MLILRGWGVAMLIFCGWFCGRAMAARMALHRRTLEQTVYLLRRLEQEVTYRRVSLSVILASLRRENSFSALGLEKTTSLQELAAPQCLSATEKHLWTECFSGMGHAGGTEECRRTEYYAARLEACLHTMKKQEEQAAQLYPRLGLCAGAMLAIFLW